MIQTDAFQYSTFVSFFNGFGKIIRYVVPELIILLENLEKYLIFNLKIFFKKYFYSIAPPLEYYYIWSLDIFQNHGLREAELIKYCSFS